MLIHGETIDDILNDLYKYIIENGQSVPGRKGGLSEVLGVYIKLTNPLSRLSISQMRGRPISPLGELLWYLSGSNKLDFIEYYIPQYKTYSNDDIIYGGYGPRLFNMNGELNQIQLVIDLLKKNRTTKKAVIQIYDACDLTKTHAKDIPCTCTLQFLIRDDKLHLFANMRSNDAYKGLVHDVFCFTMMQEIVARVLNVEVGYYHHFVSSMHIYQKELPNAKNYLDEGYQSSRNIMSPMPDENVFDNIQKVLDAEKDIRNHSYPDFDSLPLPAYWKDIVILLTMYSLRKKEGKRSYPKIQALYKQMSNKRYGVLLKDRYLTNK